MVPLFRMAGTAKEAVMVEPVLFWMPAVPP